jgi:hypothetical protein
VIFLGPGGHVVATSEKRHLPPRGSLAFPVVEAMDSGSWAGGSIEVIYTGPGPGRLIGTARQGVLSPMPHVDIQPLVQAGFGRVDEVPSGSGDMRPRRAP